MKKFLHIAMTLLLVVAFVPAPVMHGGTAGTVSSTVAAAGTVAVAAHDAMVQNANACDDCVDGASGVPSCHMICSVVAASPAIIAGGTPLRTPLKTRMPSGELATGLTYGPDPSPPRLLS